MRLYLYIIALLFSGATSLVAQTMINMDSMFNAQRAGMASLQQEFNESVSASMAEYQQFVENMQAEHREFQEQISSKWSDHQAVESGQKQWVEYSDDQSERSVVDFEQGTVKVEVLLSESDLDADGNVIKERLEQILANAMQSKGKTMDYDSKYVERREVGSSALIGDMVDLSSYGVDLSALERQRRLPSGTAPPAPTASSSANLTLGKRTTPPAPATPPQPNQTMAQRQAEPISAETIEVAAQTVVEKSNPKIETRTQEDGSKKVVASLELNLVADHISKRASQYSEMVTKHAKRFSIDEPVIYAIMEQESAFNPVAKSWVPAYGLMQLVPSSGGLDAYRHVYKKDQIVSSDYLFDPNNNIELGAAYFEVLRTREFRNVTDPQCQLLCMVAAYNCGGGNVSRAINGTTNLSKAVPEINKMSYNQLYDQLSKKLPDETKNYIKKFNKNIAKYTTANH